MLMKDLKLSNVTWNAIEFTSKKWLCWSKVHSFMMVYIVIVIGTEIFLVKGRNHTTSHRQRNMAKCVQINTILQTETWNDS